MGVKPIVRFSDELSIKPLLAAAGFVARNKEDGLALRVERESDAPLTIRRTEAELFHIRRDGNRSMYRRADAPIAAGVGRGQGFRTS